MSDRPEPRIGPGRLEAFSDGVFAIAITLLVLDLAVPSAEGLGGKSLGRALADQWPSYLAYLVSFLAVGIIWVNHHAMLSLLRTTDRPVLFANLFLLLTVSVIPFPTRLIAEYLLVEGRDAHVAAAVYSATMLLMGAAFALLFMVVHHDERLLREPLPRAAVRTAAIRFGAGMVAYLVTIGLSFISAPLTLAAHGAIAIYYCFDHLGSR